MSIFLEVDLNHQPVLIVGGGKLALRKAKEYLQEGAYVHILAPTLIEELYTLPITYTIKEYETGDGNGYFLIYAATNDQNCNQNIVVDAKQNNTLVCSANAHQSNIHSIKSYETDGFQIACSTKGSYPTLSKHIIEQLQSQWHQMYEPKMPYLQYLRQSLQQKNMTSEERKEWLIQFINYPLSTLQFLCEAYQKKHACILAFHGVEAKQAQKDIEGFLQTLSFQQTTHAFFYTFLSKRVLSILNQTEVTMLSLASLTKFCHQCEISTTIYPMLLQKGRFYHQLKQEALFANVCPIPFSTCNEVQQLITTIEQQYAKKDHTLFIVYHSSKEGSFSTYLKECHVQANTVLCHEKELTTLLEKKLHTKIVVYSLYMLQGNHMIKDIEQIKELCKNHTIEPIQLSCIQDKNIKECLILKIRHKVRCRKT